MKGTLIILFRVALTFGVLLLGTRLTGKKQLSQSTFFDFVNAVALGDIAAEKLSDPEKPFWPWLAATALWFLLTVGLDLLILRSRRAAVLLEGRPTILVRNGQIIRNSLRASFLRIDELMAHLRKHGYFNPRDVEFAVFETDGTVSVLPRSQVRPVTPQDLGLSTSYEGLVHELIAEGVVNHINLRNLGLSEEWLHQALAQQGQTVANVFYACIDTTGKLYVDAYDDPIPDGKAGPTYGPH
jgi:uncharacterized membrane protein YcaP (DUF421 family)